MVIFSTEVHQEAILGKYELPTLIKNPNVGLENIAFVPDFPEHPYLPKSVDQFLAHDQVRAQVTMDHYDENGPSKTALKYSGLPINIPPPHVLAHKLDNIDLSPHLAPERDKVTALLRSGDTYKDLTGPAINPSDSELRKTESIPAEPPKAATSNRLRSLAKGSSSPGSLTSRLGMNHSSTAPTTPSTDDGLGK